MQTIKTLFKCSHCQNDVAESGEVDTVFLLLPGGGSVPHMPCKECKRRIDAHNAPLIAEMEAEEDRKRAARKAGFAKPPDPAPAIKHKKDLLKVHVEPSDEPAQPQAMDLIAQALLRLTEQNNQIMQLLSKPAPDAPEPPSASKRRRR